MPSAPEPRDLLYPDAFVSEATLADVLAAGLAHRHRSLLRCADGAVLILESAVRILGRSDHKSDPYGLCGHVDSLASLLARGFTLRATSATFGRYTYDIERGVLLSALSADGSGVHPTFAAPTSASGSATSE